MNDARQNPLLPLELKSVALTTGGRPLLSGLNLKVTTPGVTTILGHNGAGKSLLLRLLHGLGTADTGTITWGRQSVAATAVKARQAMVFQQPILLRRSVAANLDYVLQLPHARPILSRKQLLNLASLSAVASQPARTLSGGEQQRLAFVRALATGPDIMFLDEPTANLDPDATQWIEDLIKNARAKSIKIFLVTHDIGQARRLSQDVIFLNKGRIEEHTDAASFFHRPKSAYSQQFVNGVLPASPQSAQ